MTVSERGSKLARVVLFIALGLGLIAQVSVQMAPHWVALIIFSVNLCLWAMALRQIWRKNISTRVVMLVMLAALCGAVAFPPATSKDINAYSMYGRMTAAYDVSPYTHSPRDFPADPWFSRTSIFWADSKSVYGPIFSDVSTGIMKFAGTSYTTARLCFQLLEAVALVAIVAMLACRIGWAPAGGLIGLNPLIVTFGVNDAHCDVLVGMFLLASVSTVVRLVEKPSMRSAFAAGVLCGLAVLVKLSVVPALFGACVWLLWRSMYRYATGVLMGGLAAIAAELISASPGDVLTALKEASTRHTRFSVWNPVHSLLSHFAETGPPTTAMTDQIVALGANVVVTGLGLFLIWRNRRNTLPLMAVAGGLLAYQVFGLYVLAWYSLWTLPLLALDPAGRGFWVTLTVGSWLAVAYLSGFAAIGAVVGIVVWALMRYQRGQPIIPLFGERNWLGREPTS